MATRKMTFTLPEELAVRFARRVPARKRSRYLAEALAEKLTERDRQLVRACEIANHDPEVRAIENEFALLFFASSPPPVSSRSARPKPFLGQSLFQTTKRSYPSGPADSTLVTFRLSSESEPRQ